jgi:hypothetical protein
MLLDSRIESEWHPTFNLPLTLKDVTTTVKNYWWIGNNCGHPYKAKISERKRGSGCPYCAGKQILIGFNDLASNYPEIAKQWHPIKNGTATPFNVSRKSSSKKYWWIDELGHEWESKVLHRANGSGCPACSGRLLIGFNDLSTLKPLIALEWHPTLNNSLKPNEIGLSYKSKVWWLCPLNHTWTTAVANRTQSGVNCQVCAHTQLLVGFNDLKTINPDFANEWHPTKNGNLKPENILFNDGKKAVWWLGKCGHEWESNCSKRQRWGCIYCHGNRILEKYNDLATDNPVLAAEWHPFKNKILTTKDITNKSGKMAWWLGKCGHEWEAVIANRANGARCPYCTNRKVLIGFNDLPSTHPLLASEWHPTKNGDLKPEQFTFGAQVKIWWKCNKEHEWKTPIGQRRTSNCPICALGKSISKLETEIKEFVENLGFIVDPSNRNVLNGKEIDIYIPILKFGIEFNGVYFHNEHHKPDDFHINKYKAAQSANVQLVQIWEDDWMNKKDLVLRLLATKLSATTQLKTLFPRFADHVENIDVSTTTVVKVGEARAKKFFNDNHLHGFAKGDFYLGLQDVNKVLRATISVKHEDNNELSIARYAEFGFLNNGFKKLFNELIENYTPTTIFTITDNTLAEDSFYLSNGFAVNKKYPQDYMYVIKNERKPKSEYTVEKFKSSPQLKFENNLTEKELALLNNISRIWDAGYTKYICKCDKSNT